MERSFFLPEDAEARESGKPVIVSLKKGTHPITWAFLPNGMQILLCDVPSEAVTVKCCIRAGSMRDTIPGTAHAVEHLLQKDVLMEGEHPALTDIVPNGLFGNAYTSQIKTTYERTGFVTDVNRIVRGVFTAVFESHHHLETTRWEREKPAIEQEIRQSLRDRELAMERSRALYPETPHIWHRPAGSIESVRKIDVSVLRSFFDRYYQPCNASLLLQGHGIELAPLIELASSFKNPEDSDTFVRTQHSSLFPPPVIAKASLQCDIARDALLLYAPTPEAFREDRMLYDGFCLLMGVLFNPMHGRILDRARRREGLVYGIEVTPDLDDIRFYTTLQREHMARFVQIFQEELHRVLNEPLDTSIWKPLLNRSRLSDACERAQGKSPDLEEKWLDQAFYDTNKAAFLQDFTNTFGPALIERIRACIEPLEWGELRLLSQHL